MSGHNYAENLRTPHPERWDDKTVPQFLGACIRDLDIVEILQECQDEAYDDNALAVAHLICSQVREALWYPEKDRNRDDFKMLGIEQPVSLADLPEKQAADCFGFTVVASECFEDNNIDHWIGFANGHATLLLPTEDGKKLHLVEPLSPVLSQDLEHSLVSGFSPERSVDDEMSHFGKSAIELDALSMVKRAHGDTRQLLDEHPWLLFKPSYAQAITEDVDPYGRPPHPSKSKIYMSLFLPEEGRQMIHDYDDFQHAYLKKDYGQAATSLYRLRGSYPDLDARQNHTRVKTIMRELGKQDKVSYARKLLKGYFDSFVLMEDDSRIPEAHADCLVVLAREAQDVGSGHRAAEIYTEVLANYDNAFKDAVTSKLKKVTAWCVDMEAGSSATS